MDIRKLQRLIVDALEDVKAVDIRVYNTTGITQLFDRVVIASGTSNRQTRALASSVRDKVKAAGGQVVSIEGEDTGEWVLVDLGDAIVHVMQPAIRDYYRLEEIWGAKPVTMKSMERAERAPLAALAALADSDSDSDSDGSIEAPLATKRAATRAGPTRASSTGAVRKTAARKTGRAQDRDGEGAVGASSHGGGLKRGAHASIDSDATRRRRGRPAHAGLDRRRLRRVRDPAAAGFPPRVA